MAKDSSFDVVSQIDMQEVDNAFGQAKKEISQRYDLKDSGADIALDIDRDTAGKINKDIKATKLKVKVTIEGDKLRVSGPKLDTLQEVIAFLKEKDYGQPLQFTNYR